MNAMNLIKILSTVNPASRLLPKSQLAVSATRGISRRNNQLMSKLNKEMHMAAEH